MTELQEAINYYYSRPVEFVEDIIQAVPDKPQRKVLNSLVHNRMTSVRSGHGVGKSTVEAWSILWFLVTRPFPKVPCTAPTQRQLFDVLWSEVYKWMRNSKTLENSIMWTQNKLYLKEHPEEWFAVARTATKPDAMQGFHADNLFFIIDEASGVSDKVFEPILGALTTADSRLLMCGNPTQLSGFFYESHHKNRHSYNAIKIDARESGRVSKESIETLKNMYGEDSDVFRVRVTGDFPLQADDVFIPLPLIEKSIMTELKNNDEPTSIHIGADIARFGDDKTVIGFKVDKKVEFYKKINGQDTVRTAKDIGLLGEKLIKQYNFKNSIAVKIDDGGVGGGVVDRLREMKENDPKRYWWLDIYPINFGKKIKHKHYHDSTTYMMGVVKDLLSPFDEDGNEKEIELILPDDERLVAQLSTRKYNITANSKLIVESKKKVKERNQPSPDEADCVLLLCLPVKPKKKKRGG